MATKVQDLNDVSLLKVYIALRDKRAKRKQEFTEADASDKAKQERIEGVLLQRFQERGVDSLAAKGVGTAYQAVRTSATVADWDTFFKHVLANEAFEMLERRVNKTAVEQFRNEHNDLPPGINWSETLVVNVRRK